jgi:CRP-like cAMP-binding protein
VLDGRNLVLSEFGPDAELVRADLVRTPLRAGQVLNEPGDEIRNIHFLAEGVVSNFAVFDNGHEVECVLAGRNTAVGALSAIGLTTALTRDVSIFDADAWSLPRKRLEWACRHSPRIARAVNRTCEAQMTYAIRIGACNALHAIEQRLSRWLLSCSTLIGRRDIPLGQEVFAKVLGVQRSSINPMLQRFQADGLIALGRSRVSIVDREGLRRRACECFVALGLPSGDEGDRAYGVERNHPQANSRRW